jgi:flagellar hook-associated protein 2
LHSASNEAVNVTVSRDEESILGAVNHFVTTFNDVLARIREYDNFDAETETRGALLGDPTAARVRSDLYRTLQQAAPGVETQFRYLFEVGIHVGQDGAIELDEARFKDAYEQDPEAVENLFAAFESEGSTTEEVVPGVTVNRVDITYTKLGFGGLFDQAIEKLTNSEDGTVTFADERFQELIDSANERIERIDERLEVKRERLERQFVAMEMVLAQLQAQQGPLGMISQNLMLAQRLAG